MKKTNFTNYYGSLSEYKESTNLNADSVNADARRKTLEGVNYVMGEQVEAKRRRAAMGPYGSLAPQVEKRLAENAKFLYEKRKVVTDPESIRVRGTLKKKK